MSGGVSFASIAGLGIYAWSVLGAKRRVGALLAVGTLGAAVVILFFMPAVRGETWGHLERLSPLADLGPKARYVFLLGAFLAFLPFVGWRVLLAAAPTTLLNCAVARSRQYSLRFHYDDQNIIFWIVAAIHGAAVLLT